MVPPSSHSDLALLPPDVAARPRTPVLPQRSRFPRTPQHHVGFPPPSGRAMKYDTRFRFISADRLASFTVPIKALNDAIHQRVDRAGSDQGPGNSASLGPSANSLSNPRFH